MIHNLLTTFNDNYIVLRRNYLLHEYMILRRPKGMGIIGTAATSADNSPHQARLEAPRATPSITKYNTVPERDAQLGITPITAVLSAI
jgi:hypothetical protein